jgi:hypothetical protein
MEWAVVGVLGLGALWYFILAMMGADKRDNLKGFRWKLFAMCLLWPLTLVVLAALLIGAMVFPRKTGVVMPVSVVEKS